MKEGDPGFLGLSNIANISAGFLDFISILSGFLDSLLSLLAIEFFLISHRFFDIIRWFFFGLRSK